MRRCTQCETDVISTHFEPCVFVNDQAAHPHIGIGGEIIPLIKRPLSSSEQNGKEEEHVGECPLTSYASDKDSWPLPFPHVGGGCEVLQ